MISENFNLKGKTALVTGSSQGIGEGIALALAEYGANVILHCRSDEDEAEKWQKESGNWGSNVRLSSRTLRRPMLLLKFLIMLNKTDSMWIFSY